MNYDYLSAKHRHWLEKVIWRRDKSAQLSTWRDKFARDHASLLQQLWRAPEPDDLASLPHHSALLQIRFRLTKPYLSRDDTDFYIVDNPVRKEWLFKTPMVASTGWKGAWRAAFWQQGLDKKHPVIVRLFGAARESDEDGDGELVGQAGCLHFFPTFFFGPGSALTTELVNPHDRRTGAGRLPIPFEAVDAGAEGTMAVLYVPPPGGDSLADDLPLLADAAADVLTVYGFGAKTTDGYGTAVIAEGGAVAVHLLTDQPQKIQRRPVDNAEMLTAAAAELAALVTGGEPS